MRDHLAFSRALSPVRASLYGGLAVGVLDGLAAVIDFGLRGITPVRVFQGIASGLLGTASFAGGVPTAILGLAIHFFIATAMAAFYVTASRSWPLLRRRPFLCGPLYGIGAYLFMNLVVIPLSTIGWRGLSALNVQGVLVHVFLVGLPIALISSQLPPGPDGRAGARSATGRGQAAARRAIR